MSLPHLCLVQEAYLYNNKPITAPGYQLLLPHCAPEEKIRTATYIHSDFAAEVAFHIHALNRGDLLALTLSWLSPAITTPNTLTIINAYNCHLSSSSRSIAPSALFPNINEPVIACGDINIHSRISDPRRRRNRREEQLSNPYFDLAHQNGYTLLNHPGVATRFSPNPLQRHSVIDLAFCNESALCFSPTWSNNLPHTGSDHTPIKIQLQLQNPPTPTSNYTRDWNNAPWAQIHDVLKDIILPTPQDHKNTWFEAALNTITGPILDMTPRKRPSSWSKPWWSPNLKQLRRIYHSVARDYKRGFAPLFSLKTAKNQYFNAIQKAKDAHWNDYIAQADSTQVWRLTRAAKKDKTQKLPSFPNATTPTEINKALIEHFFPPSPYSSSSSLHSPNYDFEEIKLLEVATALAATSNFSAPGPDTFPPFIWKKVHKANPDLLPQLFNPLLKAGIHPLKLKTAFGVVLPKPNKPDYSSPAAYRVIVLLETVSKILERIMCYRLAEFAKNSRLIHPHQCGSIRGLSTADAFTTLQHEIRTLQRSRLKVSTLFLDVKGGFDHVSPLTLSNILATNKTPAYIISWVLSFLSNRKCTLLFPGSPRNPLPVDVGVPQGSPISPLLFCIYVSALHIDPSPGITISYVDDFAFTVASSSYTENASLFEKCFNQAAETGLPMNIHFSLPKTDLMHWCTPKDKSPIDITPVIIQNLTIRPSTEIRWLGFQCTPSLDPYPHFQKRVNAANISFAIIRRFSSAGKGLTALNCRRLAIMAILPILTYGASCFTPNAKSIKLLETTWNSILRWVTNCFRSTPTAILHAESSCTPIDLYLLSLRLRYAARILNAKPELNPAAARLPTSFPSISSFRNNCNRLLLRGITNPPINWNSNRKGAARLPIDELCHQLLINSPDFAQDQRPNPRLSLAIKKHMISMWKTLPTPAYYTWPITNKPHPHLAVSRFISGRICQMRAHKSYLAAHPSWMRPNEPTTCPRCETEDENMNHAILQCPARNEARILYLPSVSSLEQLFLNNQTVYELGQYIAATRTGFPIKNQIPKSPLYSLSSSSSLSSLSSVSDMDI